MASKKRIAELHTLVTANAAQFEGELGRADNVARRRGAAIRKEMETMRATIAKSFDLKNLTKGFVGALGIGSGVAAVGMIFDKVAAVFEEAKQDAKEFAQYVEQALQSSRELSEQRFKTSVDAKKPTEAVDDIEQRLGILRTQLDAATAAREQAMKDLAAIGTMGVGAFMGTAFDPTQGRYGWGTRKTGGDKAQAAEQQAFEDMERLQRTIEKWEEEIRKIETDRIGKAIDEVTKEWIEAWDKYLTKQEDAAERLLEKVRTPFEKFGDTLQEAWDLFGQGFLDADQLSKIHEAEWKSVGDKLRERMRTPQEKFNEALTEAWEMYGNGFIDADTLSRAHKHAQADLTKATTPDMGRWEKAMGLVQADAMTKRGIGSGGNYEVLRGKQDSVLKDIYDLLKRALANGFVPSYGQ